VLFVRIYIAKKIFFLHANVFSLHRKKKKKKKKKKKVNLVPRASCLFAISRKTVATKIKNSAVKRKEPWGRKKVTYLYFLPCL